VIFLAKSSTYCTL